MGNMSELELCFISFFILGLHKTYAYVFVRVHLRKVSNGIKLDRLYYTENHNIADMKSLPV